MSPDGDTICTGAGDETLRFWKIYNNHKNNQTTLSTLSSSEFR
jgi:WD40 repeat protein